MNDQLDALLALQSADDAIQALETRLAALGPRLSQLDGERQTADRSVVAAQAALERESERHAHLSERAGEFRRMNDRAVGQLDQVRKARDASAAGAQVDISRRALTDAESELHAAGQRLSTLQAAVDAAQARIGAIDEEQAPGRAEIRAQQSQIEGQLGTARDGRAALARAVEPRLLMKYDRVRMRRRGPAVFALHHFTCGNCDTAIPTQRRASFLAGNIEVCESCGVLLYAIPAAAQTPAPAANAL